MANARGGSQSVTPQRMAYVALCKLLGATAQSEASLAAELRRLNVGEMVAMAQELHASLLIAAPVPPAVPCDLARPMPAWSDTFLSGTPSVLASRASLAAGTSLVVTQSGVSLLPPQGNSPAKKAVTVTYDTCAAVLAYDDGARTLIGLDGFSVTVAPEDWVGFEALRHRIDRNVSPETVIPSGPREPEPPRSTTSEASDQPPARPAKRGLPRRRREAAIDSLNCFSAR